MPRATRRVPVRLLVAVAVVLVLVAGGVAVALRVWGGGDSDLRRAVALAPDDVQRYSWTDWAGVRAEVGADVDASSSPEQVEDFLSEAYDLDLASTTAQAESASLLQQELGWSPASVEWELFTQSTTGGADLVGLAEGTDVEALGERLEGLGYTRPESDDGVWEGADALARASLETGYNASPTLQYVALVAERDLVVTGDDAAYLASVVDGLDDDGTDDDVSRAVDALVDGASGGDPLAAAVYPGEFACASLAMGQADPAEQAEGERLVAAAGEVDPLEVFALALEPGLGARLVLGFSDDDRARRNADARATLLEGPAPGQGGDFTDRFAVDSVTADGPLVVADLTPAEGSFVLSDLSTGPVLFATC